MSKAKRYRWICPSCNSFKLASSRPKRRATIRFCLPCSERTGELVERSCPVLEQQHEAREERQKARSRRATAAKRKRRQKAKGGREERAEARWHYGGYDLREETKRLLALSRSEGYPVLRPKITVEWRHQGTYATGRSWGGSIHLTIPKGSPAGPTLAVLAHELAHEAAPDREGHGSEWRWIFKALVEKGYGAVIKHELGCSKEAFHRAAVVAISAALNEKLTAAELELDEGCKPFTEQAKEAKA